MDTPNIPHPKGHKHLFVIAGATAIAVAVAYLLFKRRQAAAAAATAVDEAAAADTSANGALGVVTPVSNSTAGYPSYSGTYTGARTAVDVGSTPSAPAVSPATPVPATPVASGGTVSPTVKIPIGSTIAKVTGANGYNPGTVYNQDNFALAAAAAGLNTYSGLNFSQANPDPNHYAPGNYPYYDPTDPTTFANPARPPGSAPSPTGN